MSPELIEALKDAPWALMFGWFLYLSFKQRKETMTMMVNITEQFMKAISACCDDDEEQDIK